MAASRFKYLLWFTALVVILACAPTAAVPSVPTLAPNAVSTFIVQTANAASTQTVAAMPTQTPTATFTPTLRSTDTPEPSPTNTVIFVFFSPTIPVQVGSGSSSGGTSSGGTGSGFSSKDYACQILSVSPANGTQFNTRVDFNATWKLKNIGRSEWDRNSVDFVYLSGDKFHKVSGYDLTKTIKVGEIVDLTASMSAPKNAGTYTTYWTLRVGQQTFCKMSLTIVVK